MKSIFTTVILLITTATSIFSQQDVYPIELKPINIFDDADYTIEATKTASNTFDFKIKYSGAIKDGKTNKSIDFTLSPLTEKSFLSNFKRKLKETYDFAETPPGGYPDSVVDSDSLNNDIKRLYDFFIYGEQTVETYNDAPLAGELKVNFEDIKIVKNARLWIKEFRRDFNKRLKRKKGVIYIRKVQSDEQMILSTLKNDQLKLFNDSLSKLNSTRDSLKKELKEIKKLEVKTNNEDIAIELKKLVNLISRLDVIIDNLITNKQNTTRILDELYGIGDSTRVYAVNRKEAKRKFLKHKLDSRISVLDSIQQVKDEIEIRSNQNNINNIISKFRSNQIEINRKRNIDSLIQDYKNSIIREQITGKINNIDSLESLYHDSIKLALYMADSNLISSKEYSFKKKEYSSKQSSLRYDKYELLQRFMNTQKKLIESILIHDSQLIDTTKGIFSSKQESDSYKRHSEIDLLQETLSLQIENLENENDQWMKEVKSISERTMKRYNHNIKHNPDVATFFIHSVESEFNDGYLENIKVRGNIQLTTLKFDDNKFQLVKEPEGEELIFRNYFPLGFSRKKDFERLRSDNFKIPLMAYNEDGEKYFLPISFLSFEQAHKVNRRDYSPKDEIVELNRIKNERVVSKKLYKDETFKILEVGVFTDFVGFDSKKPNGLVQLEIKRKTNLMTHRFRGFVMRGITDRRGEWNWGILSYMTPSLSISKIENQNRKLALNKRKVIQNNTDISSLCASTLELKRHEFLFLGLDLNTFLFDFPLLKSTLHINNSIGYGVTALVDSTDQFQNNGFVQATKNTDYIGNSFQYTPSVIWEVKGDERYNISLAYKPTFYYLHSDKITQTAYLDDFLNNGQFQQGTHVFHTIQFFGTLTINKNVNKGKFFFRYRYNWQQNFGRTGFHQAQLGYSVFLLGRNNNFRKVNANSSASAPR